MRRGAGLGVFVALLAVALAGCDAGRKLQRGTGSAVWVGTDSEIPDVSTLRALEEVGIGELFVEVARLGWTGDRAEIEALDVRSLPRPTRTTLVVSGWWHEPADGESAVATEVARALDGLRHAVETARLVPAGIHLDIRAAREFPSYVRFVDSLRDELDDDLLLSATIRPGAVGSEHLDDLAAGTNFLVAFFYGQRPGERELDEAWDFLEVRNALVGLEKAKEPYLLGAVTLGSALYDPATGGAEARTEGSLAELAWDRNASLEHGFTLEGVDRQVYVFSIEGPVGLAGTTLAPGGKVRVVSTSTPHLEELLRRAESEWGLEGLLGTVFYRLPGPREGFGLDPGNLIGALSPAPALPELRTDLAGREIRRGRARFRITLTNESGEDTEISLVDHNVLELRVENGVFTDVDPGDFYRFDLLAGGPGSEPARTLSNPTIIRLYAPYLAGGASRRSGEIELAASDPSSVSMVVEGRFLAPLGRSVQIRREPSWEVITSPAGEDDQKASEVESSPAQ